MENLAFILGLLGILQAIFLPGFLLIRFGRFSFSGLRTLVLSCVLSLTLNYIIVLSLVSLHLYTPLTMRVLLLIELMALAYLSRHTYLRPIRIEGIEKGLAELFRLSPVLSLLVFFILFIFIYQALTGFGSVFTEWDAVVSWNHWAMEWSNNQFASATEHYPQLLPINFSLPYVLIGNFSGPLTLQIFAKAIALLLPLVVLMAMLDLSLNTKNPAYLLGLILMALTYKLIYQDAIGAGYADIPASIMGFISFYALYLAKQSEKALSYIALGTLIAAGAAVTKQAGCYIALLYPVLTYGLFSARHYSFKKCIGLALVQYAVLCVIILPYYLYEQHLITLGLSGSEIPFVTSGIYGDISLWQKVFDAFREIKFAIWFCLFFSFVQAFYDKEWRFCFIVIVLPYLLIWACLFSYDLRNLALIVPWIGFGAGFALFKLKKLVKINLISLIVLVAIALIVLSFGPMKAQNLQTYELEQEQQLGGEVGLWLYQYQAINGLNGMIDTDWQFLEYLPGLSQYAYPGKLTSVAVLQAAMHNSQISYFLTIDDELSTEVNAAISSLIRAKKLQVLWHWNDMTFYRINRG